MGLPPRVRTRVHGPDDGRASITIEQYESEEVETPEERLPHVLEVIRRSREKGIDHE